MTMECLDINGGTKCEIKIDAVGSGFKHFSYNY